LNFKFTANEYFANETLTKEYYLDSMLRGESSLTNIEGCDIEWKTGKNLTMKKVKKKGKRGKPVFKEVKQESFFNFFSDPSAMAENEGDDDDDDEQDDVRFIVLIYVSSRIMFWAWLFLLR
jgi:nucleosome assembly protein 1-like 1